MCALCKATDLHLAGVQEGESRITFQKDRVLAVGLIQNSISDVSGTDEINKNLI